MIDRVDEALRALVERSVLNGSGVEVAFDAPTTEWASQRTAPTVDLYLYDIREDVERRNVAYEGVRDERGRVVERRPPPRRFALTYLITAWTQRAEDEHRLLSSMLDCFLGLEELPRDLLELSPPPELPLPVTIGVPPRDERSIADVWTALGGELKPSLDLVVTIPLATGSSVAAGPPVLEQPRFDVVRPEDGAGDEPMPTGRTRAREAPAPAELVEEIDGGDPEEPGRRLRVKRLPPR